LKGNLGFTAHHVAPVSHPVLVSVPHAGRDYPEAIFANLRLAPDALVRLEDRYADLLIREVMAAKMPAIVAHRARAWIDLNRDERDIDAEMVDGLDSSELPSPSAKQRGGLGLIPRRLSGAGDIWRGRISAQDVAGRIASFHQPYHQAISVTLAKMRDQFGAAILLDIHSMPPVHPRFGEAAPQIVIGDLFGRSAGSRFSELLQERIKQHGINVALNYPYAGDHILHKHGDVRHNIHAIQLEIDRSLYLDDILREPGAGLPAMLGLVAELAQMLADELLADGTLMAAE
jgi:N-formylglutamate amidohydrolase